MTAKTYVLTASVIFALVAVMHIYRLVAQWDVFVGGHPVPMWVSIAGALVAGILSFAGFRVVQQIQRYLT